MKNDRLLRHYAKQIKKNLQGRKLALRWKNQEVEEFLTEELGIEADVFITRNSKRIDGVKSFSDEILQNKSNEYLLLISPDLKWNKTDAERYEKMGYVEGETLFWCAPKPTTISFKDNYKRNVYKDSFGNYVSSKSAVNIELCGVDSYVEIGENVDFTNATVKIHSGVKLVFKDDAKCYWTKLELKDNASLIVYE